MDRAHPSAPPFQIRVDPGSATLEVGVAGFWTEQIAKEYFAQLRPAIRTISARDSGFNFLLMATEGEVLSPEAVKVVETCIALLTDAGLVRFAFVTGSMLKVVQIKRLWKANPDKCQSFNTRDAAVLWLRTQ